MTDVRRLEPTDAPAVVDVLHEAFFDYPVMRFVLGHERADYEGDLRALIHFFVMARVFRNEVLLGVPSDRGLAAGALVSRPGGPAPPPEHHRLREEVWSALGRDAEARYAAFGEACAPFQVDTPHLHLNMIGVRRSAQGLGLGRRVLEAVHAMSRDDEASSGVTLTTENPDNLALYRHFGYELLGEAIVAPGLTTWGFYRPDPA